MIYMSSSCFFVGFRLTVARNVSSILFAVDNFDLIPIDFEVISNIRIQLFGLFLWFFDCQPSLNILNPFVHIYIAWLYCLSKLTTIITFWVFLVLFTSQTQFLVRLYSKLHLDFAMTIIIALNIIVFLYFVGFKLTRIVFIRLSILLELTETQDSRLTIFEDLVVRLRFDHSLVHDNRFVGFLGWLLHRLFPLQR